VFRSRADWGLYFLASNHPIPNRNAEELVQRMPVAAIKDLVEWRLDPDPQAPLAGVLKNEIPIAQLIAEAPNAPALQDDLPVNEYYVLRRQVMPQRWQ
jgi:hypothetical protein